MGWSGLAYDPNQCTIKSYGSPQPAAFADNGGGSLPAGQGCPGGNSGGYWD